MGADAVHGTGEPGGAPGAVMSAPDAPSSAGPQTGITGCGSDRLTADALIFRMSSLGAPMRRPCSRMASGSSAS